MKRQVVCYVKRDLISDWKRKVITHYQRAFVYGSRDNRIFSKLNKGDVLWIVSPMPGRPPELVARLNVETVGQVGCGSLPIGEDLESRFAQWDHLAIGGNGSVFFGHKIANLAMMQTRFINPTSRKEWSFSDKSKTWDSRFGSWFVRPYEIVVPESGATLFEHLSESKQVFISWKQFDIEPNFILSLAYALANQGIMAWLDLLTLPDSISLKIAQKRSTELVGLLRYGYERCDAILVVESEHYMEKSKDSQENWTELEWNGSIASHIPLQQYIFHPKGTPPCAKIPATQSRLVSRSPEKAALELKELLSKPGHD